MTQQLVQMPRLPVFVARPDGLLAFLFTWRVCVAGDWYEVPAGYRTNLGSVPWFVRWLISPNDPVLLIAAALHDWLVREFGGGPPRHTWRKSAAIMRNVMRHYAGDSRTKRTKRFFVYWGVRVFGLFR